MDKFYISKWVPIRRVNDLVYSMCCDEKIIAAMLYDKGAIQTATRKETCSKNIRNHTDILLSDATIIDVKEGFNKYISVFYDIDKNSDINIAIIANDYLYIAGIQDIVQFLRKSNYNSSYFISVDKFCDCAAFKKKLPSDLQKYYDAQQKMYWYVEKHIDTQNSASISEAVRLYNEAYEKMYGDKFDIESV